MRWFNLSFRKIILVGLKKNEILEFRIVFKSLLKWVW